MSEGASMGERAQVTGEIAAGLNVPSVPEAVAPHRRCVMCGFDVVGLPLTSGCPECQYSVAATVKRRMLRQDRNLRTWVRVGWWCWWSTFGAIVATIFLEVAVSLHPSILMWIGGSKVHSRITSATMTIIFAGPGMFALMCYCVANASRARFWACVGVLLLAASRFALDFSANLTHLPAFTTTLILVLDVITLGVLLIQVADAASIALLQTDQANMWRRTRWVRWLTWAWLIGFAVPISSIALVEYLAIEMRSMPARELREGMQSVGQLWGLAIGLPLVLTLPFALGWLTFRALRAAGHEVRAASTIPS